MDATRLRPEAYVMVLGGYDLASFRQFLGGNQYVEDLVNPSRACSFPVNTAGSILVLPAPNSRPSALLYFISYAKESAESVSRLDGWRRSGSQGAGFFYTRCFWMHPLP